MDIPEKRKQTSKKRKKKTLPYLIAAIKIIEELSMQRTQEEAPWYIQNRRARNCYCRLN